MRTVGSALSSDDINVVIIHWSDVNVVPMRMISTGAGNALVRDVDGTKGHYSYVRAPRANTRT